METPRTSNPAEVSAAYAARAEEYTGLFGRMEDIDPRDRGTVATWAADVRGPVVDIGCGPGRWSALLADLGLDVTGIDPVAEFVDHASRTYPDVPFRRGTFGQLAGIAEPLGGILSWYSLIHLEPGEVPEALSLMHSALTPGGRLLIGFFDGERIERFEHAVAPAYFWPVRAMAELVADAGFTVTLAETRTDPGSRPHAALAATKD